MDPGSMNSPKPGPKKLRFGPKAPPKKPQKPAQAKQEAVDDPDTKCAEELLRRLSENSVLARKKNERKVLPSEVAFGSCGDSKFSRSYIIPKSGGAEPHNGLDSGFKMGKAYKEPWDHSSYYPISLPMRMPYSGNPELLDEEEFGEGDNNVEAPLTMAASDLNLMEETGEVRIMFLQLPEVLPVPGHGGEVQGPMGECHVGGLSDLPAGLMGKMLVYRSGAVKMRMGGTMYNVCGGVDSLFAQDVVVINTEEKKCCAVGDLTRPAIITPDVDSMIGRVTME